MVTFKTSAFSILCGCLLFRRRSLPLYDFVIMFNVLYMFIDAFVYFSDLYLRPTLPFIFGLLTFV